MTFWITRTAQRVTKVSVGKNGAIELHQSVMVDGQWVSRGAVLNPDEWDRTQAIRNAFLAQQVEEVRP